MTRFALLAALAVLVTPIDSSAADPPSDPAKATPAKAAPAKAPPPAALPTPKDQATLEAVIDQAGCPYAAAKTRGLACIEAPLDMGFTTITLVALDAKGRAGERFVIYNEGSTAFDAAALRPDAIRAANAWLKAGGYTAGAASVDTAAAHAQAVEGTLKLTVAGAAYTGALPSVEQADRPEGWSGKMAPCARWEATAAWHHPSAGIVGARVTLATDFQIKDRAARCYVRAEELNDETYPIQDRLVVLTPTP